MDENNKEIVDQKEILKETVLSQKDNILKRSNVLIEARYNYSILANKTQAIILKKFQDNPTNNRIYVTTKELKEFTGIKNDRNIYYKIKDAAGDLSRSQVYVEDKENQSFLYLNLYPVCHYEKGLLTVEISEGVNLHLFKLTSDFTKMSLDILMSFPNTVNGSVGYRLYEIIKTHKYKCTKSNPEYIIEYQLSELIALLGLIDMNRLDVQDAIKKKKDWNYIVYNVAECKLNWQKFKERKLEPAIELINKLTDIEASYKENTYGKGSKVHSIYITIKNNPNFKHNPELDKNIDENKYDDVIPLIEEFIEESISYNQKVKLLEAADGDINRIRNAYEYTRKKSGVNDMVAYMIKVLENRWENDVVVA